MASSSPSVHGVGASVVLKLTSTLPSGHYFKVFADNYFRSLPLLEALKQRQILFAGTIRSHPTKNCPLLSERDLKKRGVGAMIIVLTRTQITLLFNRMITRLLPWFLRMLGLNLLILFAGMTERLKSTVKLLNPISYKYMGGIDKLDMMCSFYKASAKCTVGTYIFGFIP